MSYNAIIGLGNAGTQIVKLASESPFLSDVKKFAIDSVMSNLDMDTVNGFTYIHVISDDKTGSGRNRDRGAAMYKFHEDEGHFKEMYDTLQGAKSPVVVITSAAGGTGSGSIIPFCKAMHEKEIEVIPIIICPNMGDPAAYHLNTNDLMIELDEIGISTYSVFRNVKSGSSYHLINKEVVELIELIFGKHYSPTDKDSIDDSDLDVVLSTPGRFVGIIETANTLDELKRNIARKLFNGYQPGWDVKDSETPTFVTAFGLTSMFADDEFDDAFAEVNERIINKYDEYRNIVVDDNDGKYTATVIISGLNHAELKVIDTNFKTAGKLASGMKKAERPSFISNRKASVIKADESSPADAKQLQGAASKFKWKK
jgi:cell division GTPase FtsZ